MSSDPVPDTFWPEVRQKLLRCPTSLATCPLYCPICHEAMAPPDKGAEESHAAVVVPCGHVFGSCCIQSWVEHLFSQEMPADCPTCKKILAHAACGHSFKSLVVPIMRDEESQPGFCTVNASSESVSKALKTFAEAAREIRLDNRSRGLCQIFPATIPEGAGVTQDCMMCFIQETLESLNHLAASSKGQGNLKAGEFLAFAAEANGKQWTLFSKNRRRYSRIVRDHEQSLEVLRECGRVQASIRATWKNCWLSQYISHAKLTMYVCTWDD